MDVNKIDEYAVIKNNTNTVIDLAGWKLVSEKGSQSCPLSGLLEPGQSLQVWSRTGAGFSCNLDHDIWNNSKSDPAVLYNPQNAEVSRFP